MQTTAMGESLYLAFFVWAVVYVSESARGDAKALGRCALCLAAACWTRYDGWFLTAAMIAGVAVISYLARARESAAAPKNRKNLGLDSHRFANPQLIKFVLIATAAPALWLAYNGIVYRNPLEFENGPYSAKAIEKRTQSAGSVGHPGSGNPAVAGLYFLKSAQTNIAGNVWLQRLWIALGLLAFALIALWHRSPRHEHKPSAAGISFWLPLAFLLIPLPFYALSIAYGGVPIFIPAWWPFSHYNVRYGLQLLPAFAAAAAIVVYRGLTYDRWSRNLRMAGILCAVALLLASYFSIWRTDPICLSEAAINMRSRNQLERQLADWLKFLPVDSALLMYLGDHVGALEQAGIPLKRVINEGNHRVWKQPTDPEGLWERALANPARYADYVIAFEGDSVWQAVQTQQLREVAEIHATGQARAIVYRTR